MLGRSEFCASTEEVTAFLDLVMDDVFDFDVTDMRAWRDHNGII